MTQTQPDTDLLLDMAAAGDPSAAGQLFERCRPRLVRMMAVRLDASITARVDPSDVVQECLAEAHQKLPVYLQSRPVKFYPWLRAIAWQRLVKIHRTHITRDRRSVHREGGGVPLPDESTMQLVDRLASSDTQPSERALRSELHGRVRTALDRLGETDRDLLVMRYLEQMPLDEIAEALEITLDAAKKRHRRALERLETALSDDVGSQDRHDS